MAEYRQHAGVVSGESTQQALAPLVVVQHLQVGVGQFAAAPVDHLGDAHPVRLGSQPQRTAQTLFDGRVATGSGKDKRDRRQQTFAVQCGDHIGPRRWPVQSGPAAARTPTPAAPMPWLPVRKPVGLPAVGDMPHEFGIHPAPVFAPVVLVRSTGGVIEEIEQSLAHQHVLPQRHRPVLVDHHRGVTAHGFNPATEFLGIADRGRKADQPHVFRQVQDDLLPHGTPHPVSKKVHFVHHDIGKPL